MYNNNNKQHLPEVQHGQGICWPPHLTGKYGTRPFFRWDRAQGRSPHAPGVPKNAYGPFGIPQAPGDKPNLPEGSKSLGGRPPEAVGNTPQAPRHTRPDPRPDSTAGQSATQHLERSRPRAICRQTDLCRTGPAWSGLMITDRVGIYEQT